MISPILFIIFLQDIFKELATNGVKYADDGTIWVTGTDIKELSKAVEEDLEKISENLLLDQKMENENKH